MGLGDVRHAIRIVRSGGEAGRRDVSDLRRDVGHYGAQLGVVVTSGDAGREARSEAAAAGQLPIVLLCGEALAEALADAGVGCVPVVVPEVDEGFFKVAAEAAEREEAARKARREERDEREKRDRPRRDERGEGSRREDRTDREGREGGRREVRIAQVTADDTASTDDEVETTAPAESVRVPVVAIVEVPAYRVLPADEGDDGDEDGPDEGPDEEGAEGEPLAGAAPGSETGEGASAEGGAAGERRRRRRRRRRRGGRGRGREGAPGEAEGVAAPAGEATAASGGEGAGGLPGPEAPTEKGPAPEPLVAPPAGNGEEPSR
jgi:hypothetical protein